MRIRLGYVAIALKLPKVTASSQLTYSRYKKLIEEERINELKRVTRSNMEDLVKILSYNAENNIHFYRITSKLIPLATHPDVIKWEYEKYFKIDLKRIGELIKKHHMRVDTHPDHFNVLNSTREEVVAKTIKEFLLHDYWFEAMNYKEGKMVIHIGSGQGGKDKAIERFVKNFHKLPLSIKNRLIIENDDKLFTAEETLSLCKEIGVPMVLDIHHHVCNSGNHPIEDFLDRIFYTWEGEYFPPKVHISSPKEGRLDKRHADYINPRDFIIFIEKCVPHHQDIDVMIEAKQKDLALYKLVEDVKKLKPDWKWIDSTTIEI
ncbi:UV DNA damage repair endonuclease UvsE [Crassaminicella profunda]|uniref:UV DNA damage repair endonuclease UvsE n=1 Tax=Crassaminicella profunda TaxID=1286698 RepID=UPI001CA77764|nr:UV DNA damage repair endonuclease UvsE [Crassaminicella profunda]QZY54875.1 UV DNA damage repair endonuclease UvsE [Crassaminicella profunda]